MFKTNITTLRIKLSNILDNVVKNNEIVNVNTKNGNAVIISEDDYNGIIVTIELSSNSKLKKKILKGKNTNLEDCIDIDVVKW